MSVLLFYGNLSLAVVNPQRTHWQRHCWTNGNLSLAVVNPQPLPHNKHSTTTVTYHWRLSIRSGVGLQDIFGAR